MLEPYAGLRPAVPLHPPGQTPEAEALCLMCTRQEFAVSPRQRCNVMVVVHPETIIVLSLQ